VSALLLRGQQMRSDDKALRSLVFVLIAVYVGLIVLTIALGKIEVWTSATAIPIMGVPVSVVLWSALGSLAAILYRFYAKQFGRMTEEVRWLIARPIVGIIMGCLGYLTIVSGLVVFGSTSSSFEQRDTSSLYVFWIVAFLAGFSDKFFESIIALLAGKLTAGNTQDED